MARSIQAGGLVLVLVFSFEFAVRVGVGIGVEVVLVAVALLMYFVEEEEDDDDLFSRPADIDEGPGCGSEDPVCEDWLLELGPLFCSCCCDVVELFVLAVTPAEPAVFPRSSRYASLSSSGTTTSGDDIAAAPSIVPLEAAASATASARSLMIVSFAFPHPAHTHPVLSLAIFRLAASLHSNPPTCPFASESMNARIATSAVRIPHAGCHVSS